MAYIQSHKHAPDQQPRFKRSAAFTALALAVPGVALAQQEQTLSTVSVTAETETFKADTAASTKYTAPLVDTPKTLTVITKEVLQQTNATTLQDALRTTPGITFGMGEGGTPAGDIPIIRGFKSEANFFIDGLRDPSSQSRDMFAVEQVDVTKGPDSAYSGGGAVGGSINLSTKNARLGNFGDASIGVGTANYKRATADINRQIGDHMAARLSLMKEDSDVAGREAVWNKKDGVAASLAAGLGTPTRASLSVYHYQTEGLPDYGIPYNNPIAKYATVAQGTGGSTATTPPTVAPTLNPTAVAKNGDGGPLNVNRNNFYGLVNRDFSRTEVNSQTLKLEHDINDKWTVRNSTRFTQTKNDYVVTNPGDSNASIVTGTTLPRSSKNRNSTSDSVINATELVGEFFTGDIKHNIATGIEFMHNEVDSRGYTVTGASNANIQNPNPNDPWTGTVTRNTAGTYTRTASRGIYVFDTLTLNKQWLLNLGLRDDEFRTSLDGYTTNGTKSTTVPLQSRSSFTSYQAGVVFKPKDNGSIYANYATAANPSGITASDGSDNLSLTNKDLEPEEVRSLELGTKWNLFNNKLALTGAVFNIEKTNAKISLDANTMATVGKQRINGYELGFAGNLTDKWQVTGGYTYMDSELVEPGPSYWSKSGTNWRYNANAENKGNKVPNTPEHSFSVWTSYRILPQLTIGGGAYYVSKVYGDAANTKWVPSYWRADAMATYQVDKNLSLRLNVQNLFDEVYYDKAYASHMVSVAPGRQAILTANYKF
ncbi:MAG: TonB-dependent siderophore receptor [Betaproteobacteria bacterium]|nr:MAG: TonB-dependent siderophore receptor [Betaproteobacteria bacterium]